MIESGFVQLIQSGLDSQGISVSGGFAVQLPKDLITSTATQAWTYRSITSTPTYFLTGQDPLTTWEVQIDCHGYTMANAMALARGIDNVLRGSFFGILSDVDSTVVQGIFRQPSFIDGFNDTNRSFVRSLEYRVIYIDATIVNTQFTYYIDPHNGNDVNTGLSYNDAWLTTTAADALTLTGIQSVGYLFQGTWFLYRKLNMTADETALAANVVTETADGF